MKSDLEFSRRSFVSAAGAIPAALAQPAQVSPRAKASSEEYVTSYPRGETAHIGEQKFGKVEARHIRSAAEIEKPTPAVKRALERARG